MGQVGRYWTGFCRAGQVSRPFDGDRPIRPGSYDDQLTMAAFSDNEREEDKGVNEEAEDEDRGRMEMRMRMLRMRSMQETSQVETRESFVHLIARQGKRESSTWQPTGRTGAGARIVCEERRLRHTIEGKRKMRKRGSRECK